MTAPSTAEEIRDVNTRYHDGAAAQYDAKWGIDWGEVGSHQVILKTTKALGERPTTFRRSLEIGAGTGYFSLHLLKAGIVDVIVPENPDAADDPVGFTERMSSAIAAELHTLHTVPAAQRLGVRLQRYRRIGVPGS